MGTSVSISEHKNKYIIFLNISFLFVGLVSLVLYFNSTEFLFLSSNSLNGSTDQDCKDLHKLEDHKAKCFYLNSKNPCVSQGYIDYLSLFYCNFGRFPFLGHFLLFLWLLVLFYLLGNTASEYFCNSLESLSSLLKLSPTIAGVPLLSLGNGASDVFANLVSFMGGGIREIGLNAVVGGASFVTCVVVGTVNIFMHQKRVFVNKPAFIRDVCFLLFVLVSLALILIQGEINLWSAIGFSSMYTVYVIIVYITHLSWTAGNKVTKMDDNSIYGSDLSLPILNESEKADDESEEEVKKCCFCLRSSPSWTTMLWILEMPLYLPRRLTIPVVCEKRWSKPIAVALVTLAPIFLSALWNLQDEDLTSRTSLLVYGIGLFFGVTFGVLAFMATKKSSLPKKCLISWLAGGFLMSVIWTYITAQELVALLMSLEYIYGISSSILGLTVLAWGNSFGDLITNLTMALNDGPEGAQAALSGCYAGPIFNTLVGLGLSLVGSSWYAYPSPVLIPENPYLLETLGLLVAGLIWALVVLPMRDMRLDMVLGGGLIIIYLMSISLRLSQTPVSPKLSL